MDRVAPYDQVGVSPVPDFVNASPSAGIRGSIINAEVFNALQHEIVNTIASVLTPNASDYTQLLQAIDKIIAASFTNGQITQQTILNLIGGVGFSGSKKIQQYMPSSPSSQTLSQEFTAPAKGTVLVFSTASSTAQPGLANFATITVNGTIAAQTGDSVGGSINDVAVAQVKTGDDVIASSMIQNSQALTYNVSQQLNYIFLPS